MLLTPLTTYRSEEGVELPPAGRYATGIFFLDEASHQETQGSFENLATAHGLKVSLSLRAQD